MIRLFLTGVSGLGFRADESVQARVVVLQAPEEEPQRTAPAPFEFVADWADFLQGTVRGGDENPCAVPLGWRIHGALREWLWLKAEVGDPMGVPLASCIMTMKMQH